METYLTLLQREHREGVPVPPLTTQLQKPHTGGISDGVVVVVDAVAITVVAMVGCGTISGAAAAVAALSFDGVGVAVAVAVAVVFDGSSSPRTINDIACQAPDNL